MFAHLFVLFFPRFLCLPYAGTNYSFFQTLFHRPHTYISVSLLWLLDVHPLHMAIPLSHLVRVFVTDIAFTRIHILVSFCSRCASFAYGYSSIPPCQSACNTYCIYTKPPFVQESFLAGDLFVLTLIPWPRATYMCFKSCVSPNSTLTHIHSCNCCRKTCSDWLHHPHTIMSN